MGTGMTSSATEAAGPPAWRPQPGEVLVGVLDRCAIGHTPQGPVRAVMVTAEPTGAQVSLWLSSTILLSLFVQHQPHPGERIGVRYRWRDLDYGYHRWMLIGDRPEALAFSPLGGEASDEAPWHHGRGVALARLEPASIMATRSDGRLHRGLRIAQHMVTRSLSGGRGRRSGGTACIACTSFVMHSLTSSVNLACSTGPAVFVDGWALSHLWLF